MKNFLKIKKFSFIASDSGAVAALSALMLTVFLGFTALVFDIGRLALVKGELQRAADAGALAGARAFVPYTTIGGVMDDTASASNNINKTKAAAVARTTVLANKVAGSDLTDCLVEANFWNLTTKTWSVNTNSLTEQDLPAVRVSITKAEGQNSGPVRFAFGSIIGKESSDLTVTAMAVLPGAPGSVAPGGAFPFAVPKEAVMQDNKVLPNLWNNNYTNPGHFTSFKTVSNAASYLSELMKTASKESLAIGDNIWISQGNMTSLFGPNDLGAFIGKTVLIPVVDKVDAGDWSKIVGFIAFSITKIKKQGNDIYIEGRFIKNHVAPGTATSQIAPFLGTWASSAKLIQ